MTKLLAINQAGLSDIMRNGYMAVVAEMTGELSETRMSAIKQRLEKQGLEEQTVDVKLV